MEVSVLFTETLCLYELTNTLGSIITTLQKYNFTKMGNNNGQFSCKLYNTKESNWYDIEVIKMMTKKDILRMLKSAIVAKENEAVLK